MNLDCVIPKENNKKIYSMQSHNCRNLEKLKDRMNNLILKSDLNATARYYLHGKLDDMPNHHKACHGNFTASQVVTYILGRANAT